MKATTSDQLSKKEYDSWRKFFQAQSLLKQQNQSSNSRPSLNNQIKVEKRGQVNWNFGHLQHKDKKLSKPEKKYKNSQAENEKFFIRLIYSLCILVGFISVAFSLYKHEGSLTDMVVVY